VYGFLLVLFSNFVPKTHRFWDIRLVSIPWPWNPGWGSLKVTENYPIQSGTHDFLLTFHSNHRPILHRFRDKRRYPSKIARKSPICPTPVYLTPPLKGFSLELGIGAGAAKNLMMGLPDSRKSFKIGLAGLNSGVWRTASQPARHVAIASTRYAYLRRAVKTDRVTLSRRYVSTVQRR